MNSSAPSVVKSRSRYPRRFSSVDYCIIFGSYLATGFLYLCVGVLAAWLLPEASLGRALLIGSIPVAYAFDALTFPHMLVVAFLMGTLTVLFHVSYSSFYPALVPRDRLVEGGLGVLLARPHRFEFLVDHVADLRKVADAQALGVRGRRVERQLLDGDIAAGELLVEARVLCDLGRGKRHRHVARLLVPLGLHRSAREVGQELRDPDILGLGLALQHPQGGAADDRVLRLRRHVG